MRFANDAFGVIVHNKQSGLPTLMTDCPRAYVVDVYKNNLQGHRKILNITIFLA
jgi:hypothetical protein